MPVKRASNPTNLQKIWNAIRIVSQENQFCDGLSLRRCLENVYQFSVASADLHVKRAVQDGMIIPTKLTRDEEVVVVYKITSQEMPILDDHDWYCWECCLGGDVLPCSKCHRVYHLDCIPTGKKKQFKENKSTFLHGLVEADLSESSGDFLFENPDFCSICNIADFIEKNSSFLDKPDLNYLLKFVLNRIKSWLPTNLTHKIEETEPQPDFLTDSELTWRANQLFFVQKTMSNLQDNLNMELYSNISQFLSDIFTIQHNVTIFHGHNSQEFDAAKYMILDTIHDISEIRKCSDCYRHSNEKSQKNWFCLPCKPAHRLVWAKQKGYPYWPAKVIKETASKVDVRFFGGKYERAVLVKSLTKPIETPKEQFKVKMSAAFHKAFEELKQHQKLLKNPPPETNARRMSLEEQPKKRPLKRKVSPKTEPQNRVPPSLRDNKKINQETVPEEVLLATSPNVIDLCGEDPPEVNNVVLEDSFGQVSSSTELSQAENNDIQHMDLSNHDAMERLYRELENNPQSETIIHVVQNEIERLTSFYTNRIEMMTELHKAQISQNKKKQWCYYCEKEAIYHCCWNTAYCSPGCQQQHWQAGHKQVCRRKR